MKRLLFIVSMLFISVALFGCSDDTNTDKLDTGNTEFVTELSTEKLTEGNSEERLIEDINEVITESANLNEASDATPSDTSTTFDNVDDVLAVLYEDDSQIYIDEMEVIDDKPSSTVNENVPFFKSSIDEVSSVVASGQRFSELDSLGRCGKAVAIIGKDIMPTEERGGIGHIRPSGWHTVKYSFLEDLYLYNRCHLIGYQLTGENDNELNLITGTRYMNVEGMEPFENSIATYVEGTNNHVLYRVTPIFEGDNLVAHGVLLEAMSLEDKGAGLQFCVYCYNIQPGIKIDYLTGDSEADDQHTENVDENLTENTTQNNTTQTYEYVLNTNTKKFHYPYCSSVNQMKDKNKKAYNGSRDELINMGYGPCGNCSP